MANLHRNNILIQRYLNAPAFTWKSLEIFVQGPDATNNIVKFAEEGHEEETTVMRAQWSYSQVDAGKGKISKITKLDILPSSNIKFRQLLTDFGLANIQGSGIIVCKVIDFVSDEGGGKKEKAERETVVLKQLEGVQGIPRALFGMMDKVAGREWMFMEDAGSSATSGSEVDAKSMLRGCMSTIIGTIIGMSAKGLLHMNIRPDNISIRHDERGAGYFLTGLSSALPINPSTKLTDRLTSPPSTNAIAANLFAREIQQRQRSLNLIIDIDAYTSFEKSQGLPCGTTSDMQSLALSVLDIFGEGLTGKVWEMEMNKSMWLSEGVFDDGTSARKLAKKQNLLRELRKMVMKVHGMSSGIKQIILECLGEDKSGRPSPANALERIIAQPIPAPVGPAELSCEAALFAKLAASATQSDDAEVEAGIDVMYARANDLIRGSKRSRDDAEDSFRSYAFAPGSAEIELADESVYSDGDIDMDRSDFSPMSSDSDSEVDVEEVRASKRMRMMDEDEDRTHDEDADNEDNALLGPVPVAEAIVIPIINEAAPIILLPVTRLSRLPLLNGKPMVRVKPILPLAPVLAAPQAQEGIPQAEVIEEPIVPGQGAPTEAQRRAAATWQARFKASNAYKAGRPQRSLEARQCHILAPTADDSTSRSGRPRRAATDGHPYGRVKALGRASGSAASSGASGRR